ncbi:MAG: glycosyltransferase, partial [Pseudomonadota bacterium]
MTEPTIAVLIPCYNEEKSIARVVSAFAKAVPHAKAYVYDNNSSDETVACAKAAGAIVRTETQQGKGNVVRRMFADINADVFILVDGDDTYDASAAPALINLLLTEKLDMVTAAR